MIGETSSLPASTGSEQGQPSATTTERLKEDTRAKEIGGREGPDPTRYGDWEKNGRCIDF